MKKKLKGLYVKGDLVMYDGYVYDNPFYVDYSSNVYLDYCVKHLDELEQHYYKWRTRAGFRSVNGKKGEKMSDFLDAFGYVQDIIKDMVGPREIYNTELSLKKRMLKMLEDMYLTRENELKNANATYLPLLNSQEIEKTPYKLKGIIEDTLKESGESQSSLGYQEIEISEDDLEEMYIDLVQTFDEWVNDSKEVFRLETSKLIYLYFFEYLPIRLKIADVEELSKRNKKTLRAELLKVVASDCEDYLGVDAELIHDTMMMLLEEYRLGVEEANDVVVRILSLTEDIGSLAGRWLPKSMVVDFGKDAKGIHRYRLELEGQDGSYSHMEMFSRYKIDDHHMRGLLKGVLKEMTPEQIWFEDGGKQLVNSYNITKKFLEKYGNMFEKEVPLDSKTEIVYTFEELEEYI